MRRWNLKCVSCIWQVIPSGHLIPASSLPNGLGGTCMGRPLHSFPEPHQYAGRVPAINGSPLRYSARTELADKRFNCPRCPCTYSSKGSLTEHDTSIRMRPGIGVRLAGKATPFAHTITNILQPIRVSNDMFVPLARNISRSEMILKCMYIGSIQTFWATSSIVQGR